MEEEDVRGDRGLSVFRLRAVSRLTLVVRCTEISYSVSTQVLGFRFGCGWCCVVGFLFGCCWFCVLLLCVSAWWNRGILDEVTKASDGRAVTGTAVMARSANEEKKNPYALGGGSGLGQPEIPTPCSCARQLLQRSCPRCCTYNLSSSQLPAHASKSTATGFHRRVLACPLQLCRTTHRPRPRSHWIYGWPSGRSDLSVEFCRS